MSMPLSTLGPYAGLLCNALVWGVSWWPLRHLQSLGLHPLWATVFFFLLGGLLVTLWRPAAWRGLWANRSMWWLAVAAGSTNAAFNWAVSIGDVVRVVLLFYLMPLWTVGLAWLMMGEPVSRASLYRMVLAMVGAALVLWPDGGGWLRFDGLADVLGLAGGMGFAWTNVLLRQQAQVPAATRALAMFVGGAFWPLVICLVLVSTQVIPTIPSVDVVWMGPVLAMGLVFFISNLALQYGAARLPVQVTSVVMLTEILFATGSSVWWGQAELTHRIVLGGVCIMLAAWLSSKDSAHA